MEKIALFLYGSLFLFCFFFTRSYFVIGIWALNFARKLIRIEIN
jgi:hypothetical protein